MSGEKWRDEPLGDLCELINGRIFHSTEWAPSGLPIVRIQNLNDPSKPFNFFAGELEERFQIDTGTPLIAWSGNPGTSFGAHLWDRGKAALNQHIFRVEVNESRCDKKFLVHAVNFKLKEWISDNVKGWAGLRHLRKGDLLKLRVPLPLPDDPKRSLEVQRLIANRLDAQLESVKVAQDLLTSMRQDSGRLLAASIAKVQRNLGATTREVQLGLAVDVFKGRAKGEGTSSIRVFKTKHVYPHRLRMDRPSYLNEEQVSKMESGDPTFLRSGDVLMTNMAEGTLGRVTFVEYSGDKWTTDAQVFIIRSKNQREVLSKWIYYCLWSDRGQGQIRLRANRIVLGKHHGQIHLSAKMIQQVSLPLPSPEQQRLAVQHLDRIRDELERVETQLQEDADQLRRAENAIMAQAFSQEAGP